jgi:hypothetical protein
MPTFFSTRAAFRAAAALAATVAIAGCVTAAGASPAGNTSPAASDSPTPAPTPSPTPAASVKSFYLRAWQTQALAPQLTFNWLPQATISDGTYIDGIIAVPAIYPGPLYVEPTAQTISQAGIEAIVAEAKKDGLLSGKVDFSSSLAVGGVSARLVMTIDGTTYQLTGDPTALDKCNCSPAPGTPEAFAAFWQKLTSLGTWLADDLGPSSAYTPERLAVLATPPTGHQSDGAIQPTQVPWPLSTPFSKFGTPMGNVTHRCGVVTGSDLAALMPVVQQSNQLTRFIDSEGTVASLQVRAMVPGEPSPCG